MYHVSNAGIEKLVHLELKSFRIQNGEFCYFYQNFSENINISQISEYE